PPSPAPRCRSPHWPTTARRSARSTGPDPRRARDLRASGDRRDRDLGGAGDVSLLFVRAACLFDPGSRLALAAGEGEDRREIEEHTRPLARRIGGEHRRDRVACQALRPLVLPPPREELRVHRLPGKTCVEVIRPCP